MFERRIAVAPMLDCTDRHARYFLRLIAPHVLLYTEMITTAALIYGDYRHLLQFDPLEHPVAIQLGGSDPQALAHCASLAEAWGYDEVNLNVGCPSNRVQAGGIGACLMLEPQRVADCVFAMCQAVKLPITVKCRIGVDVDYSYTKLKHFISGVAAAGCQVFIVHARKAWLKGLSPKENRELPPLEYSVVRQLKQDFPQLSIIINGGIKTTAAVAEHLQAVDGVMIGREAYSNPYWLAELEKQYFSSQQALPSRLEIMQLYMPYIEQQLKKNVKLSAMTRHIFGLFYGQKGAHQWRRYLSEHMHRKGAGIEVVETALSFVSDSQTILPDWLPVVA